MFNARSVLFLMIAALVTGVVQCVGLHRAAQLWNARAAEMPCPAPPAAVATSEPGPPEPEPASAPTTWANRIGWLSVGPAAVEIDFDGRRMELAGYPPPRSKDHAQPRLTTVVFAPDGGQIAVAGECFGQSGVTTPQVPSCARAFVRLYRAADGAHVRDLRMPWNSVDMERRVLAMAFDEDAERLAVLVTSTWADCSWGGSESELLVYRVADGARLLRRDLSTPEITEVRELRFDADGVRMRLAEPHKPLELHVVRLRKQNAI
jgi:hypothetical protein